MASIEERLAEVEARQAIAQLIANYCFFIDDRDIEKTRMLFTEDAYLGSGDKAMGIKGRDAIMKQFEGRFNVLGAGSHITHNHTIDFESATRARGVVSAHAEVLRNGKHQVASIRYNDIYDKSEGVWRFAERLLSFFYYVNAEDYAGILGKRDRNRTNEKPMPANIPEDLASWQAYHKAKR
jgi:ketosteroid isomerase-like protein